MSVNRLKSLFENNQAITKNTDVTPKVINVIPKNTEISTQTQIASPSMSAISPASSTTNIQSSAVIKNNDSPINKLNYIKRNYEPNVAESPKNKNVEVKLKQLNLSEEKDVNAKNAEELSNIANRKKMFEMINKNEAKEITKAESNKKAISLNKFRHGYNCNNEIENKSNVDEIKQGSVKDLLSKFK